MELFDTHSHIFDESLLSQIDEVVDRANAAGVQTIIAVGCTVEDSQQCIELAERFDSVYASVGIQPNYTADAKPDDWQRIVELVKHPKVIAIGETGLDKYWDNAPFEIQQDYFDRHLRLSQEHDLPFIVHMRDCGDDIAEMLEAAAKRGPLKGVMHSYTGDEALCQRCLDLDMYISFAGMVTFKKSDELRAVAKMVPEDRLLIETDSPYLSPHPKRSQRPNEPALVKHTAECLAEVRGLEFAELAEITTNNARRLFLPRSSN
ncbi:MAG: hydrolase TatD [Blastopirellula sp.]|nr:MAG: hydrolase TatD [Blastopirellula sp.]